MGAFRLDYSGIGEMLTADWMRAAMVVRAEAVKDFAEATAPYDPKDKDDHYRDHFKVESGVQHHRTSRAFAAVMNDHVASVSIEFGTAHTPAHHTLTRAIDAAKGV